MASANALSNMAGGSTGLVASLRRTTIARRFMAALSRRERLPSLAVRLQDEDVGA